MFIAINEKGERINALQFCKESLPIVKQSEHFFCPICQQQVLMKIGEKNKPHFAHRRDTCPLQQERESPYHLYGKELLYNWFVSQNMNVELEYYISSIKQRPDLLLISGKTRVAVEFQCSVIPPDEFVKRTTSYWSEGIRVLWIIGGNQFKRNGSNWLHTTSFHTLFIQGTPPFLLYFCPNAAAFYHCSHITPYSSSQSFSHIQYLPLQTTSIHSILSPSFMQPVQLAIQWNKKKRRWRESGLFSMRNHSYFLRFLYEKSIPPSLFPSEIAVPLPSLVSIHTPALLWQSYVLLEELERLEIGESFSWLTIYARLTAKKRWKPRLLPYFPPAFPKLAFVEYGRFLEQSGIIRSLSQVSFQKTANVRIPVTVEEALKSDDMAMQRALSLFQGQPVTSSERKRI